MQEKTTNGDVELVKVPGVENPGDAFTKYLDKGLMEQALARMKTELQSGESASALSAAGAPSKS